MPPIWRHTIQFDAEYQVVNRPKPDDPSLSITEYNNGTVRFSARGKYHTKGLLVMGEEQCSDKDEEWSVANSVNFKSKLDIEAMWHGQGMRLGDGGALTVSLPYMYVLNQGGRTYRLGDKLILGVLRVYYKQGKTVRSSKGTEKLELEVIAQPRAVEESEDQETGPKPDMTDEETKGKELAEKFQKELEAIPESELTPEEAMALAKKMMEKSKELKMDELQKEMKKKLEKAQQDTLDYLLESGAYQEYRGEKVIQGSRHWEGYADDWGGTAKHSFTWSFTRESGAEDARVMLDGCTDLTVGRTSEVTATAEPAGGTFRYWVEPAGPLSISPGGSAAKLTGKTPGRTTIHVEYTSPQGKKATHSLAGSCVRLKSVNNGAPIPQVAQTDAEGKITNWIQTVPLEVEPADGGELLIFARANPAILTAVTQGNNLEIKGIQPGKTTLQPQSRCGENLGPPLAVEVVICHKDYIAKLKKELDFLNWRITSGKECLTKILNDPEFRKADGEFVADTLELAWDLAKAILSSIGAVRASAGTKAIARSDLAQKTEAVFDAADNVKNTLQGKPEDVIIDRSLKAANLNKASAAKDLWEAAEATEKFGQTLGALVGYMQELEDCLRELDENKKKLEEVKRKLERCKVTSGEEPETDKGRESEKKPKPPSKPKPGPEEKPTSKPGDKPKKEEPPLPPPPPEKKPGKSGLPLPPEEEKRIHELLAGKGCGKLREMIRVRGSVAAGLKALAGDVEAFQAGPLAAFEKALEQWQRALDGMISAAQLPAAQRREQLAVLLAEVEIIKQKALAFGEAGDKFLDKIGGCGEAVPQVIGPLREKAEREIQE